jgi:hypothetical protein
MTRNSGSWRPEPSHAPQDVQELSSATPLLSPSDDVIRRYLQEQQEAAKKRSEFTLKPDKAQQLADLCNKANRTKRKQYDNMPSQIEQKYHNYAAGLVSLPEMTEKQMVQEGGQPSYRSARGPRNLSLLSPPAAAKQVIWGNSEALNHAARMEDLDKRMKQEKTWASIQQQYHQAEEQTRIKQEELARIEANIETYTQVVKYIDKKTEETEHVKQKTLECIQKLRRNLGSNSHEVERAPMQQEEQASMQSEVLARMDTYRGIQEKLNSNPDENELARIQPEVLEHQIQYLERVLGGNSHEKEQARIQQQELEHKQQEEQDIYRSLGNIISDFTNIDKEE